jgi:DNA helicase MCM9
MLPCFRLSQAHARLLYKEEVTTMDAVVAVSLIESSMQGSALLPGANIYHTSFPENAMQNYRVQGNCLCFVLWFFLHLKNKHNCI